MPHNKSHHYVPAFYLRRFSADKRHINLYNLKSKKKVSWAKLSKQCCKDYFYGKDPTIEKTLAATEAEIASIMRQIDAKQSLPSPNSPAHFMLIIHILMQYGRTLYTVDAMSDVVDGVTKQIYGQNLDEAGFDIEQFRVGFNDLSAFSLGTAVSAYPLLLDLRSKLLIDRTGEGFITSDTPVVFHNTLLRFRRYCSNCGLPSKGLQIFLPLDKNKMLTLYDDFAYRVGSDRKKCVEITDKHDVYELNVLQMCSALENIYFKDLNFNVEPLHKKALPYLRSTKALFSKSMPRPHGAGTSQIVGSSMTDISTNLSVSFITIRKSARRWLAEFRQRRVRQVLVVRNQTLYKDYHDFHGACEAGEYHPSDFVKFVRDRHVDRSNDI